MRIFIDARLYGLENAGLGRYAINLISELQKLDKKNQYILALREKYYKNLKLQKNFKKILADFHHYTVKEQLMFPKIIKKEEPDLVHFLHFNVPLFYKGDFLVTIHDILMHKQKGKESTTLPFYLYFLKRIAYKLVFQKAVFGSRAVIAPSNFAKDELINYYNLKNKVIHITHEGIDDKFYTTKTKKSVLKKYNIQNEYFIYAGNAYPHKNLDRAIEAIVALNQESAKKIILVLVSARGVFLERLRKTINKHKAEDFVITTGYVSDEDLVSLYANAVAFLYPSIYEGFGLQGLEAIAAGTLVLASEIPVFKEIYEDKIMYFNPYDFTAIKKSMKSALDMKKNKRQKIIKEAQKFAKRYSWSQMAKETLKIYESFK